jgi:hypothetical protein
VAAGIGKAAGMLRARHIELRWSLPPFEAGVGADRERRSAVAEVVDDAVRGRARATRARAERLLRKLGAHVMPPIAERPALERTAAGQGSERDESATPARETSPPAPPMRETALEKS